MALEEKISDSEKQQSDIKQKIEAAEEQISELKKELKTVNDASAGIYRELGNKVMTEIDSYVKKHNIDAVVKLKNQEMGLKSDKMDIMYETDSGNKVKRPMRELDINARIAQEMHENRRELREHGRYNRSAF